MGYKLKREDGLVDFLLGFMAGGFIMMLVTAVLSIIILCD